jgi:hypothetical protein
MSSGPARSRPRQEKGSTSRNRGLARNDEGVVKFGDREATPSAAYLEDDEGKGEETEARSRHSSSTNSPEVITSPLGAFGQESG